MIDAVFLMGSAAAILTTIAFLPQVIKAAVSRQTRDLSWAMFILLAVGIFLWFIYGMMLGEWPLILANGITFVLAMYILFLKSRYG